MQPQTFRTRDPHYQKLKLLSYAYFPYSEALGTFEITTKKVHSQSSARYLYVLIWALITSFKSHLALLLAPAVGHPIPLIPGMLSGSIVGAQSHYELRRVGSAICNQNKIPLILVFELQ